MLVISRKSGQTLRIGPDIEITVVRVDGDQVRIGIAAPKQVAILRGELIQEIQTETQSAISKAPEQKADLSALKLLSKRMKTQTPAPHA